MNARFMYRTLVLGLMVKGFTLVCGLWLSGAGVTAVAQKADSFDSVVRQVDSEISVVDAMLARKSEMGIRQESELLCRKAEIYARQQYFSTAISLYEQAVELLESVPGTEEEQMAILGKQSKLYMSYEDYGEGMECLYQLLRLAEGHYPEKEVEAYVGLANYAMLLENRRLAHDYLGSASSLIGRLSQDFQQTESYAALRYSLHNAYAGFYERENIDSAFWHLDQAERYADRNLDKMCILYQNRAVLYGYLKDYSMSEAFFKKAMLLMEDEIQKQYVASNIAELERLKGNLQESLALYSDILKNTNEKTPDRLKIGTCIAMADLYAKEGDSAKAYSLLSQARALSSSGFWSGDEEKILGLQRDFERFRTENAKRLYEYQSEVTQLQLSRKNILIALFSVVLLFCVLLAVSLYRRFQKQRERTRQLSTLLKQTITKDEEALQSLQEQTEKKNRELMANFMSMAKTADTIAGIMSQIEELKKKVKDEDTRKMLSSIENQARSWDWGEHQWAAFKLYFEQVHPAFFSNLNKAYPTLTPGENRICAFIVMNLTTKDIATLLNRSSRTIDTIKFRIRKKLDIPKDVSTLSFLLPFTQANKA